MGFVIVGTWFFLNLFIGVIFSNFIDAQKRVQHAFLNEDQVAWTQMQSQILKIKHTDESIPTSKYRLAMYKFIKGANFERCVYAANLTSTVMLSLHYDSPSSTYQTVLDYTSYLLTLFFMVEITMKFIAYHPLIFFGNLQHIYEIVTTIIFIIYSSHSIWDINIGNSYSRRIVGGLRILSVGRVLNHLKGVQSIKLTLKMALPLLANIVMLALVVFFCYAIFGCYLFSGVKTGEIIDDYTNFDNLINAMIALFRCSTSDDCKFY